MRASSFSSPVEGFSSGSSAFSSAFGSSLALSSAAVSAAPSGWATSGISYSTVGQMP